MSRQKKKKAGSTLLDVEDSTRYEKLAGSDRFEGLDFDALFSEEEGLEIHSLAQTTNTIVQAAVKLTELIVDHEQITEANEAKAVEFSVKEKVFGIYHEAIREVISGISGGMDEFISD